MKVPRFRILLSDSQVRCVYYKDYKALRQMFKENFDARK